MTSRNATYAVEAFNVLLLLLFVAWLPFCFQVMSTDEFLAWRDSPEGAFCAVSDSSLEESSMPIRPPLQMEHVVSNSMDVQPEVPESTGKQDCQPSTSRLSLMSFLIALIGGGVFSLEAFEAFPML
eukprot:CAMPEP_0169151664 /NCGR_PEP_ID=MMETSP1015-20121227/50986_1 /TAXON_ID=342587 /ORGANISM="Karlodinium micrum, Strain CCMP2283" /LENGTH=125 /DNA_ID=CAMNT_0009221177 /DNA_START=64 /DNA_END=441 /DNA_ORIENTATION=-